jgi:hypothetical protein
VTSAVTRTSPGLGPAEISTEPGGGDVADVQPAADVLGEQHVAGDDRLLGDGRPAGQAEPGADLALVHLGALGEPRLLGVLGDDAVERLHVLQRAAHQHGSATQCPSSEKTRTLAAESAIAPSSASCLPARPTVTAPIGCTSTSSRPRGRAARPARPRRRCRRPGGVGHRVHRGVAAEGGGPEPVSTVSASSRPGSRRWVCRSTRPGSATSPARRSPRRRRSGRRRSRRRDQQVGRRAAEDGAPLIRSGTFTLFAPEQQVEDGHPDADAVGDLLDDRGAGESATSAAISMPRFIGPGCMTIACSGSLRIRAPSRP